VKETIEIIEKWFEFTSNNPGYCLEYHSSW
jgi:hypothetical protein